MLGLLPYSRHPNPRCGAFPIIVRHIAGLRAELPSIGRETLFPTYFFSTRHGSDYTPDPVGVDLPNVYEARIEGDLGIRQMVAERIREGRSMMLETFLEVTNVSQEMIYCRQFGDVLRDALADR